MSSYSECSHYEVALKSQEQLEALISEAKSNPVLIKDLQTAASQQKVSEIAKEHGYSLNTLKPLGLSEFDLENVAGTGMAYTDTGCVTYGCVSGMPTCPE